MDKQSTGRTSSKIEIFFRIFINFDEGFQVFVSKTALMWSTLMFFIGFKAFQLRNAPAQYSQYLYSLLRDWAIVVVINGFGIGIALNYYWIVEEKFGDLNEKKLNKFILGMKLASGWLFIVGMFLLILAGILRTI